MNHKVFQILSILRPQELKSFERWLRSPWCNSQQKLHELFVILRPYHPNFDSPKLSKERLFDQLYPNHKYSVGWLRNLFSGLSQQAERFLKHQMLEKDDNLGEQLLLQGFRERHQTDWFQKRSQKLIEKLEEQSPKDSDALWVLSRCYEQIHRHPELLQKQLTGPTALDQAQYYLEQAHALSQYRFLSERNERHQILQDQPELAQQLEALENWTQHVELAAVDVYRFFLKTDDPPGRPRFEKLRRYFLNHLEKLCPTDQSIFLFLLLNEAARLRLRGAPHIHRDIFALFRLGLDRNLLLHHDRMSEVTFTNIITMAQLSQAYDFALQFIEAYSPHLAPHLREDARNWGQAYIAFHTKHSNAQALELALHQRGNDLTTFSVRSRILLLQLYFEDFLNQEGQDINFLLARSEAFGKQLRRKRSFPQKNRTAILRMLYYLRKLAGLVSISPMDMEGLAKLKAAMLQEPQLHSQGWLLKKVEELGQRR